VVGDARPTEEGETEEGESRKLLEVLVVVVDRAAPRRSSFRLVQDGRLQLSHPLLLMVMTLGVRMA
jgi:hypothetical protein